MASKLDEKIGNLSLLFCLGKFLVNSQEAYFCRLSISPLLPVSSFEYQVTLSQSSFLLPAASFQHHFWKDLKLSSHSLH